MDPNQFKLFKQITLDYFAKLAPDDTPAMGEPYMQFGEPRLYDYTSMVEIQGEYSGYLYLTSRSATLEKILEINGEDEVSERTRRDMCRELSNVLAGNASQAFGGNWDISVPISMAAEDFNGRKLPESSFIMPIRWRQEEFLLVVGLRPAEGN